MLFKAQALILKISKSLFNLQYCSYIFEILCQATGHSPHPTASPPGLLGVFAAVLKPHTLANFEVDFKLCLRNLNIILCLITAERARYGPSRMDNAGSTYVTN